MFFYFLSIILIHVQRISSHDFNLISLKMTWLQPLRYTIVLCQPLYGRMLVFWIFCRFLSRKLCFRVVFLALRDKGNQKYVLNRQLDDLDVWHHLTSWPQMTSKVWNGTAKIRKLTLQTHLQIGSNNFSLTWPVALELTWRSTKYVFHRWIFQLSIAVLAFPISGAVSELWRGGGEAQNAPIGWWVAKRPSARRVKMRSSKWFLWTFYDYAFRVF